MKPMTIAEITRAVGAEYGIAPWTISSRVRRKPVTEARDMAVRLARELAGYSQAQIGRCLGNRGASTIHYAELRAAALVGTDQSFTDVLARVIHSLARGDHAGHLAVR